jgi:hypothetical protein
VVADILMVLRCVLYFTLPTRRESIYSICDNTADASVLFARRRRLALLSEANQPFLAIKTIHNHSPATLARFPLRWDIPYR